MKVIEKEKYYFVIYESKYNKNLIHNSKPYRQFGTAYFNLKELIKHSFCKNGKILEIDILNPKKSRYLQMKGEK